MILLFWFAVAGFFTWRLSSLLARERGPLALFTYLRWCVGVEYEPNGAPSIDTQTGEILLRQVTRWDRVDAALYEIAQAITCVWCNSLWIAFLISAPLVGSIVPVLTFTPAAYILTTGGLSALSVVIDKLTS